MLVNVDNDAIRGLVEENSYYRMATIPGGMYRGNEEDVTTFGVGATFVSSTAVSDDVMYNVVKAIFENLDQFKALHPALDILDAQTMVTDGNSAPIHDGAARYYREAGLMD